eukprot:6448419-Pyramimonas_sp.AAC.1
MDMRGSLRGAPNTAASSTANGSTRLGSDSSRSPSWSWCRARSANLHGVADAETRRVCASCRWD